MKTEGCNPNIRPDEESVRQSLNAAAAEVGAGIYERYGPHIGWAQLLLILEDRNCVRYPCEIAFDATPLLPGEFAHPVGKGDHPRDGFTLYVHPHFSSRLEELPALVLYQLVIVNYGAFATAADAEAFGAAALGMSRDEYYEIVCRLVDELP